MSNRKLVKAVQSLFRQIWKLSRSLSKGLITWLLRTLLVTRRRSGLANAGFVLPTTVLLLLVVSLTVGTITYRAFNRTSQAIGQRQQTIIYNSATPVMDRAKAKIEYLLRKDERRPGGVPSDFVLDALMKNNGSGGFPTLTNNPYLLPGETQVDVNGDNQLDAAWSYQIESARGPQTVVYSVVMRDNFDANNDGDTDDASDVNLRKSTDAEKARVLVTRNGPLNLGGTSANPLCSSSARNPEGGWYPTATDTSRILKTFQVDAVVIGSGANRTITTLELQQDRQVDRGNKWGAWFRNDLEIFPGPDFNWNGAMHTRGSLIVGDSSDRFRGYMISSPGSCVYRKDASEVTITTNEESPNSPGGTFEGQIIAGSTKTNAFTGSARFDIFAGAGAAPITNAPSINRNNDSIGTEPGGGVAAIALDPIEIVTTDASKARATGWTRDPNWKNNSPYVQGDRVFNDTSPIPYLDDIYRADNRWGPKPVYNSTFRQVADGTKVIGEEIDPATAGALINDVAPPGAAENLGLDGYWERRARVEGLRLIVGQRLELGNPFGWVTPVDTNGDGDTLDNPSNNGALGRDLPPLPPRKATVTTAAASTTDITRIPFLPEMWGDPLYPPDRTSTSAAERQHEARQRRALRDNLAAVQSTAVYQWDFNNDYPLACVATTVHPGTQATLDRSTNFVPTTFAERDTSTRISLISNFFLGRGTNGWEFEPPSVNATNFATAINSPTSALRKGLKNLSRFAGDPRGGFPAVQEPLAVASGGTNRNIVHPYPRTTMWGDYSELRRVIDKLDGVNPDGTPRTPVAYANLSPADKTVLHTAACTLGMLAYNVRTVEQFQSSNPDNQTVGASTNVMSSLAQKLAVMTDGDPTNGEIGPTPTTYTSVLEREYTQVRYSSYPPEAYIERLKQAPFNGTDAEIRLAEMIYLSHQVNRDRLFGFRGSPVYWYEYDFDPTLAVAGEQRVYVPLACDPEAEFLGAGGSPTLNGTGANPKQRRLALARLCGHVRFKQALTPSMVARTETDLTPSGSDSATNRPFRYDGIDVGPRFPSLYYIFPRFTHDHDGAVQDLADSSGNPLASLTSERLYQPPGMLPSLLTQDEAETRDGTPTAVPWVNDIDHRQPGNTDVADRLGNGVFRAPELRQVTTGQYDPRLLSPQGDAPNQPNSNSTIDLPPEPYVVDINIRGTGGASDTTAVVPSTFNYERFTINDLETIWVRPRTLGSGLAASTNVAPTSWTLPAASAPNSPCRPTAANPNVLTRPDGSCFAVALQDKALFNGREIMNARVLDLDLDMMRRSVPTGSNDTLIPTGTTSPGSTEDSTSGIIYAFREDAIREDKISRPAINRGTALDGAMNAVRGPSAPPWTPNATTVSYPVDPTLNTNGISKKPVDYYPDPDRRPFGFRLRKGVDLRRAPGGAVNTSNLAGMSFISDDPVYIQGNFNHHSTDGTASAGSRLEEFTQLLTDDWSNFYNRTATQIDNRFASTQDAWRPAEILSDGITVLSDNFVDGTIEEGFLNTGSSSYRNQRGPSSQPTRWLREIPWRSSTAQSDTPILVSRNGNPLYCDDAAPSTAIFSPFSCRRPREFGIDTSTGAVTTSYNTSGSAPGATGTRINAIIVSGIVPSQAQQSYGGFHNFPRFIQNWGGQNLYISGSFLQLNFSNYATGPFDHDALEPGQSAISAESIPYYSPPNRRWGYDVGLQYAPAGPVARRFVTIGSNWSEYYKELPVDDPYVANLRCAKVGGTRVINDTTITCP
jgi:hypothetical protein